MIEKRIQESLRFWRHNLGPLLTVTLPFAIVGVLLQVWLGAPFVIVDETAQVNGAGVMAYLMLYPFAEGAIIAQLAAIQAGRPRGLADCLAFAVPIAPMLFIVYALIYLPTGMGLMAFILPGAWIYTRLCLAPYILALEKKSIGIALRDSLVRTAGDQWLMMLTLCVLVLPLLVVISGIQAVIGIVLGDNLVATLLIAAISGLLLALVNVLVFRFHVLAQPPQAV